jgi:hypothetical protein
MEAPDAEYAVELVSVSDPDRYRTAPIPSEPPVRYAAVYATPFVPPVIDTDTVPVSEPEAIFDHVATLIPPPVCTGPRDVHPATDRLMLAESDETCRSSRSPAANDVG